jgi:hypothetical protein
MTHHSGTIVVQWFLGRERHPRPRQLPLGQGWRSLWCHLKSMSQGQGPFPPPAGKSKGREGTEGSTMSQCLNRRRVPGFLAISVFRLSSSFLITISLLRRLETPGLTMSFRQLPLASVPLYPLIRQAEEPRKEARRRRDLKRSPVPVLHVQAILCRWPLFLPLLTIRQLTFVGALWVTKSWHIHCLIWDSACGPSTLILYKWRDRGWVRKDLWLFQP